MSENQWGADPAKYKRLSKTQESAAAQVNANAFMAEVGTLREKYLIPELTVQFAIYVKDESGERGIVSGGAGWGDQMRQAELSKAMFDREFDHLCLVVGTLAAQMPSVKRMLLTDPGDKIAEVQTDAPTSND